MNKFLFLALLCFGIGSSQIKAESSSQFPVSADWYAGFDNLGAHYYVKDNTFFKEKEGKILSYKNISFGKIGKADVINPMNIVLFYKDFNAVVFLDNQLNEIRRVNFFEFREPVIVSAVGNASQNRLWIYESLNQQLGLFDYLRNSVTFIGQPLKGNIVHYETDFNYFNWLDDQGNRFASDLFGKVFAMGKFPAESRVHFISDNAMLISKDSNLYYFALDDDSRQLIDLGKKSVSGFWYNAQNLAIFTPGEIAIYKLKLR